MTITATSASTAVTQSFNASHFDDAGAPAAATFYPGFKPNYVIVENATDRTRFEWFAGTAAATAVKTVAAGTRTLDTAAVSTITVTDGARPSISFPVLQNKQYRVVALG